MIAGKFAIGILILLFIAGFIYFNPLISFNIIGGFVIYLLIAEILDKLERKGFGSTESVIIVCLSALIMFLIITLYLSIPFYQQMRQFVSQGEQVFSKFEQDLAPMYEKLPFLQSLVSTALDKMREFMLSSLRGALKYSNVLVTTAITLPLITAVLLASRKTLKESLLALVPNNYFEISVLTTTNIATHIQKYVFAKTMETLALIIIFTIGFLLIGLPSAFLYATLSALLNIIPIVGILLNIPLLALAAASGNGVITFGLAILVLIIAQILDNTVLQTWIIAKIVDVHPFIVIVATFIGGELLGFAGLVIAIPAYVIAKIILSGLYEYLKAVQRHEKLLAYEEQYQEEYAHN